MLRTVTSVLSSCSMETTEVTRLGDTHDMREPYDSASCDLITVTHDGQCKFSRRNDVVTAAREALILGDCVMSVCYVMGDCVIGGCVRGDCAIS